MFSSGKEIPSGFSFGLAASTTKPSSSNGLTTLTAAPTTSVPPAFGTTTLTRDDNSEVTNSSETREPKPQFTFLARKEWPKGTTPRKSSGKGCQNGGQLKLESPWRNMDWTEERRTSLMETITSYRPSCGEVPQARVLLLGPVSSGKSSFISSVQSVFNGRVTNRAMVGSFSSGFTKKSFNIRGKKDEDHTGLVLCDTMGMSEDGMTGLTLHDILSVVKGHVPEGHKFSPDQPVSASETVGYVKRPSLKDKVHCVAFVVDASKITTYPKGLSTTFKQLRKHISDLGVHQVALLSHVDQVCLQTAKDVTGVYESRTIQDVMGKAAALLGMSTSYIVPVKNYSSELDLDVNTDVLLLSAVDHILQYADLYFQDNAPQNKELKTVLEL
ncbi:interferon-induced protein 44-like isoform X2 [Oreochromis aureus]|uniref:interferon-induced protein 44-like isoform X2 n=1 Tax=Oreochromis aureus TaxID=47969 RepID=UPI0019540263|nr:interferon-induced protein 44-like isoform X2 [Oreochromis aureus]